MKSKSNKQKLIERVLMAGRETGTRAIMFHQLAAQRLGINPSDMRCLEVMFRTGPTTPSQIAKLTGLTTGSVTILVDRLENAGLAERKPDPSDRRRTMLVPTTEAIQRVGPLYHPMAKKMAGALSKYKDSELKAIERYFLDAIEIWRKEAERLTDGDTD